MVKTLTVSGTWDNGYGYDYPFTAVFDLSGEKLTLDSMDVDSPHNGGEISDHTYQCIEQRARDLAWDKLAEEAKL